MSLDRIYRTRRYFIIKILNSSCFRHYLCIIRSFNTNLDSIICTNLSKYRKLKSSDYAIYKDDKHKYCYLTFRIITAFKTN